MSRFVVRRATAAEAALVHGAMAEAYAEYRVKGIGSGALEETVDYVRDLLVTGAEGGALCLEGTAVVGSVRFLTSEGGFYFRRLGVRPAWRGQGAARATLAWLEECARQEKHPFIWCKVRAALPENIRLYQRAGYELFDRQVLVKPDGRAVEVVFMRKLLG
ncbi:MAG: GNAT family N-acetyltransferase [Chitinophagales bacterium]